nr:uncharacterized protein C1orf141 homolog isoform X2 [Geotrypetes seraphini]
MHSVNAPLISDFESECDPISAARTDIEVLKSFLETKEDEKSLIHKQTSSLLEPLATARRRIRSNILRPFSIPKDQKLKPAHQKGDDEDLCKMYGEVGKLIANRTQRVKQSQVGRCMHSKLANQNSRKLCCKQDSSDHKKECLKITLHPSDTASEDKADFVSLSLEDEIKKSDVKILSIKKHRTNSPNLSVNETYPIIYNDKFSCRFLKKTQSTSVTDPASCDSLSEKREKHAIYRKASPVIQNSLEYARALLERRQNQSCNLYLKKNEKQTKISSKQNISIHILAANDTSEILQFKPSPILSISKSALETEVPVNKLTSKSISFPGRKHEPTSYGLILHGINPAIHLKSTLKSKTHCVSLCQPVTCTCSCFHTNSSLDEMVKWEYVSIAKPLSAPGYKKNIFPRKDIALNDSKLQSPHSQQEDSVKVVPSGNVESSNISGMTRSLIYEDYKETTVKSISSQQADFTEETPTDTKLDDKELYLDITNGQDPQQNCRSNKPSPMQDPQTQLDNKATQMQEATASKAAAAGTFSIRSRPIINIPTAHGIVYELEEVNENDIEQ